MLEVALEPSLTDVSRLVIASRQLLASTPVQKCWQSRARKDTNTSFLVRHPDFRFRMGSLVQCSPILSCPTSIWLTTEWLTSFEF